MEPLTFHWADYLLFGGVLFICTLIGIIQGVRDRWGTKKTASSSNQPERDMSLLPVIWSITATSFSSNFVLGFPAEMYYLSTEFGVTCIGFAIGIPTGMYMFINKLYELKVPSVFDYIGLRFGNELKGFLTVLYALAMLLYMGLIIYAPALAFGNSSNLEIWVSVLITGLICIVYTTLGGLKGVLWIDTLQMLIVLGMGIANCAYGTYLVGGISEVWETAVNGSRIEFTTFDADPTIRHSFWSCVVGGIATLWLLCTNQAVTQKFLGLPNRKQVAVAGFSYLVVVELFCCIYMMSGIVIYAYYAKIGCEPTQTGLITRADQLVPFFVLDAMREAKGLAGLFTAAVFGASLSTVSAGINALAALTIRDVIGPMYKKKKGTPLANPMTGALIFKGLSVFWGLVALGVAFLAPLMGRSVLQIGLTVLSLSSGPLVGVLIIGMYVPFTEKIGAFVGVIVAIIFEFTLLIGAQINRIDPPLKPLPDTDRCPVENITEVMTSPFTTMSATTALPMSSTTMKPGPDPNGFFQISYLLYAPFGIMITIVVAMITSGVIRLVRGQCVIDTPDVDNKLLCNICVPKNQRDNLESLDNKDDVKEQVVFKNGTFETKNNYPVSQDDVTMDVKHTNDVTIAASFAFAHDNHGYSDTERL